MERRTGVLNERRALRVALLAVAVAGVLLLTGCITSAGTPSYSDLSLGRMRAIQPLKSANAEQLITEYGVFYSTDLAAIRAIDADPFYIDASGNPDDTNIMPVIESQPDVKVAKRQMARAVTASSDGTLTIDLRGLMPGTTYYTRFYAVGQFRSDGQIVGTLFAVNSHTTSNPTLSKVSKSKGTLSPKFSRTTYAYKNTISRATKGSRVTVVPSVPGASVQMKVGATGAYAVARSKYVAVSKGKSKVLYIKVTAPDGIAAEYAVTIKRK